MANLLQSCQTVATQAPGYYSDYLSNLANKATSAAGSAQFAGATPLQQQAFSTVGCASTAYKPTMAQAGATLGAAGTMAQRCAPLTAAQPYLGGATAPLAGRTQTLMNPYVKCVVNSIGTLGQQNIQQNLAPMATAGAVGSGQFGSQRGAQVLGQTLANANQQILSQQAQALMCGYKTAQCGALRQGALCAQAGSTAGNLASTGAQNLANIGTAQSNLAATCQNLGLAGTKALACLGAQQQTINQNQQLFPLTALCKAAGVMKGFSVPTSTTTTMNLSTLAGIAALGSTAMGIAKCPTLSGAISSGLSGPTNLFTGGGGGGGGSGGTTVPICFYGTCYGGLNFGSCATSLACMGFGFAEGGAVGAPYGCATNKGGALPTKR